MIFGGNLYSLGKKNYSLFVHKWHHGVCTELQGTDIKQLPQLICNNSKVTGHKVNVYKSVSFFHTSNESLEFEIKNIVPFILGPPN